MRKNQAGNCNVEIIVSNTNSKNRQTFIYALQKPQKYYKHQFYTSNFCFNHFQMSIEASLNIEETCDLIDSLGI